MPSWGAKLEGKAGWQGNQVNGLEQLPTGLESGPGYVSDFGYDEGSEWGKGHGVGYLGILGARPEYGPSDAVQHEEVSFDGVEVRPS